MDLARTFLEEAVRSPTCAGPALACAPDYAAIGSALSKLPLDLQQRFADTADVLGAACSVAAMMDAKRTELFVGKPAWGVVRSGERYTICLWDGRTIWAQSPHGATRVNQKRLVIAWAL